MASVHRSPLLAGARAMAFYGCPDDCYPTELVASTNAQWSATVGCETPLGSTPSGPTVADPAPWRAPAQWLDPSFWSDGEQSLSGSQQVENLQVVGATPPQSCKMPRQWFQGHRPPKGLLAKAIFLARQSEWEAQCTGRRVRRGAVVKSPRRGRFQDTLGLASGNG